MRPCLLLALLASLALSRGSVLEDISPRPFPTTSPTALIMPCGPEPTLYQLFAARARSVWNWVMLKGRSDDNVIGRCFGVARKLRIMMPMIIFKLGVIVTTLAFLTVFSMKALGLLFALLFINGSSIVAKLVSAIKGGHGGRPPAVHYHIHPPYKGWDSYRGRKGSGYYRGWDRNVLRDLYGDDTEELLKMDGLKDDLDGYEREYGNILD